MTSFVGKWKLLWVLLCCGYLAFAKAYPTKSSEASHTYHPAEIATYSIDKNTSRNDIFDLFKELFLNHSIKAKLNDYKRHAGVITVLDLTLTDANNQTYPLKLEGEKGINPGCLTVDEANNTIVEFAICEMAQAAVKPIPAQKFKETKKEIDALNSTTSTNDKVADVVEITNSRELNQEVNSSRKEQTNLKIEAARSREKQRQEERRLDILERKAKLEAQQEANRIKNEQLAKDRAAKREQQLQEVRDRQQARIEKAEAARIAKLEEEKRQIAIETARIETQAQAEKERLAALEKERLAAQKRQEERRLAEEKARNEAIRLKEAEKEKEREIERVRKRLDKENREKARLEKERVKKEKEELEAKRLEREIELEQLAQQRLAAQQELDRQLAEEQEVLKRQRELEKQRKEKEFIDERERYRKEYAEDSSRKETLLDANNENYIPEDQQIITKGFLLFNGDQCSFKVIPGKTYIYDSFGNVLFEISDELIDAPQSGRVVVNRVEAIYEFTDSYLVIKNNDGDVIDEKGKVVGAKAKAPTIDEVTFNTSDTIKIDSSFTKNQVINNLKKLEVYNIDYELLEVIIQDDVIVKLAFRLGNDSYLFNEDKGIHNINLEIDGDRQQINVVYND